MINGSVANFHAELLCFRFYYEHDDKRNYRSSCRHVVCNYCKYCHYMDNIIISDVVQVPRNKAHFCYACISSNSSMCAHVILVKVHAWIKLILLYLKIRTAYFNYYVRRRFPLLLSIASSPSLPPPFPPPSPPPPACLPPSSLPPCLLPSSSLFRWLGWHSLGGVDGPVSETLSLPGFSVKQ